MTGLTKWLIGLIVAWILFTLISCVCEAAWTGAEDISTKLYVLLHPEWSIDGVKAFVGTFWAMLEWDYPFLQSGIYVILRYIGIAVSVVIGFIIVFELVQMVTKALGNLLPWSRGI